MATGIVGNKEIISFYYTTDKSVTFQKFILRVEKENKIIKVNFNYEANRGKLRARLVE